MLLRRYFWYVLLISALVVGDFGAPVARPAQVAARSPRVVINYLDYPSGISLNEFMPDPHSIDWNGDGVLSQDDEYIELYNANDFAVDLSGWQLDDREGGGSSPYVLPAGTMIAGHGFLVIYNSESGTTLNNSGDSVRLLRPDGILVEEIEYTSSRDDEAYSKTTDGGTEWTRDYPPSPGASNQSAPPTATATSTVTPTSANYPTGISVNEFMPDPDSTDWNGDGTVNQGDEYVELYNSNNFAIDLSGWLLDDKENGGSSIYTLPVGTVIAGHSFLVIYQSESGVALNNSGGDWVRLLRPDSVVVEAVEYSSTRNDEAYSKTTDGGTEWTRDYLPSPGQSNQPTPPTPSPTSSATPTETATSTPTTTASATPSLTASATASQTATETATQSATPTASPTASTTATETATASQTATETATATQTATPTPSETPTPSLTPSPTPTPSPTGYPAGVSLNEFMPDPHSVDWNGDGRLDQDDEYVEIYNANDFAVDLSGWLLDDMPDTAEGADGSNGSLLGRIARRLTGGDGSRAYALPAGSIVPARGFLLIYQSESGVALNNSGDSVRLLRPDGLVVEETAYASSRDDEAYSKSSDGGSEWTRSYPPSPGQSNQPAAATATPTATPTPTAGPTATLTATATPVTYPGGVSLNEFMPDPASDWDGDGAADLNDEYIELYNANLFAVDLSGWLLDDVDDGGVTFLHGPAGSPAYPLPAGTMIAGQGFLVIYRSGSGIALNNSGGDWVRLLQPDGVVVEAAEYSSSHDDEAYSKSSDGGSEWVRSYPPSPGQSNQPPPATATPTASATPSTAGIEGWVFEDVDADGRFEPWAGETGIAGVLLMLSDGRSRLSGSTGWYGWHNLPPGDYLVRQAQPLHTASTSPDEIALSLAAGELRQEVNFGERFLPPEQVQSPVSLNEFLPAPGAVDWDGNGQANAEDEWIELVNASDQPLDLSGWLLDDVDDAGLVADSMGPDGSAAFVLPPGTLIAGRGFLVFYRSETSVALNNSGDTLRLLGPGSYELEAVVYGSTGYDLSWSKTAGGQWTTGYPPSPGRLNQPGTAATATQTPTTTPGASPTASATPTLTATPVHDPGGVSLNEFLPDPASDWDGDGVADLNDEYIELYNGGDAALDLSGWWLDDVDDETATFLYGPAGSPAYALPAGTSIEAGGFLVIYRSESGVALNNSGGDWARLLRPDRAVVDEVAYSESRNDEAYARTVDGTGEWTRNYPPSPGQSNQPGPTATQTPTVTPGLSPTPTLTPTATPTATPPVYPGSISLNEFLPDPASDWDGDGVADLNDEYIELYNGGDAAVDLSGWLLDDVDDKAATFLHGPAGSPAYALPPGTSIEARGFLLVYRSESGVALNNSGGDWARLLRPGRAVVDEVAYSETHNDEAYARTVDGAGQWTRSYPPSPGQSNQPGPTATPTMTPTATPTAVTPTPFVPGVGLNEFLPRPQQTDWNGDGEVNPDDEYIELYNGAGVILDLSGWLVDDGPAGSPAYVLLPGTSIPAQGYLLLFRSETGVALNDSGGDQVRLLRPDGSEVESYAYDEAAADRAFSKEIDGGATWTSGYPPSPGGPNRPAYTEADVIRLNEVLASPKRTDWDGNGQADYTDEWIELVNAGQTTVKLDDWKLADGPPTVGAGLRSADWSYTLPAGLSLAPGEFLLVFRWESGISLSASDEWVRLLYPDDLPADSLYMERFSGYDQSWCRLPDGLGGWTLACEETPGRSNRPGSGGGGSGGSGGSQQPYDRFAHNLVSAGQARSLPDDTLVTIEGQVTVLPGPLGAKQIYLQDGTGGILIYLYSGEWPPLTLGQWLRVNGPLDTYHGEREVRLTRIDDIKTLGPGLPPPPVSVSSGQVGEAYEGRLVQLSAPVSDFWGETTLYLDDGSGEAKVTLRKTSGLTRPYVNLGEVWTVVGVVSQWDDDWPFDGGYRLLPWRAEDLQRGRLAAPLATGGATALDPAAEAAALGPPLFLPVTGASGE